MAAFDPLRTFAADRIVSVMWPTPKALAGLLHRWARELHSSLYQLGYAKTFGRRMGGYSRSQRVEAKYFLLAMAPVALVLLVDEQWGRGPGWHVLFWASVAWATFVIGAMFAALFKSLAQSFGRKR